MRVRIEELSRANFSEDKIIAAMMAEFGKQVSRHQVKKVQAAYAATERARSAMRADMIAATHPTFAAPDEAEAEGPADVEPVPPPANVGPPGPPQDRDAKELDALIRQLRADIDDARRSGGSQALSNLTRQLITAIEHRRKIDPPKADPIAMDRGRLAWEKLSQFAAEAKAKRTATVGPLLRSLAILAGDSPAVQVIERQILEAL